VVWRMAKDHPFLGVGGGNYPYLSKMYWPSQNILDFPRLGVAVDNDYAQTLAEFGAAGWAILLATLVMAAWLLKKNWGDSPPANRRLVVAHIAGVGLVFVAAWVESPFRSPPVLVAVAAALACAPGLLTNPQSGEETA